MVFHILPTQQTSLSKSYINSCPVGPMLYTPEKVVTWKESFANMYSSSWLSLVKGGGGIFHHQVDVFPNANENLVPEKTNTQHGSLSLFHSLPRNSILPGTNAFLLNICNVKPKNCLHSSSSNPLFFKSTPMVALSCQEADGHNM